MKWRKTNRAKKVDSWCGNHKACVVCRRARTYQERKERDRTASELKEYGFRMRRTRVRA